MLLLIHSTKWLCSCVLIYASSNTAAPNDYVAVYFSGQFDVGDDNGDEVCIAITIIDDDAFEKDENFTLCLESEYNVDIENPEVYVVIKSEDGKFGVDCASH